jgi:guanosine-3',5'-bis(diphosphate) 3'-pyrophosphohydrolase
MRILERTFNRAGKPLSRESLKPVLHRLGHKEVEDALAAVGRGELISEDVFQAVSSQPPGGACVGAQTGR